MRDPIEELESFGSGGLMTSPLPAAEVRRLGDRRRSRRRTALTTACAAVVAAAVVPVVVLNRDGGTHGPGPAHHVRVPAPKVITYPGSGISVKTAADAAKLTGTSPAFKAFIAGEARRAVADGAACPGAAHEITVQKYSTAGYAIGGFNSCGGYAALWANSGADGAWGEGQATQDMWDCDALAYLNVPTSFTGPCAVEAGDFATPGAGGAEPGMSKAQLTALGLIVSGPVPGADPTNCPGVEYGSPVLPSTTAGLYDPQDGLVDIYATSSMKTAEKVGLGTPSSRVFATYPRGHYDGSGDYIVPRPAGRTLFIQFGGGRVSTLRWELNPHHCGSWLK